MSELERKKAVRTLKAMAMGILIGSAMWSAIIIILREIL